MANVGVNRRNLIEAKEVKRKGKDYTNMPFIAKISEWQMFFFLKNTLRKLLHEKVIYGSSRKVSADEIASERFTVAEEDAF